MLTLIDSEQPGLAAPWRPFLWMNSEAWYWGQRIGTQTLSMASVQPGKTINNLLSIVRPYDPEEQYLFDNGTPPWQQPWWLLYQHQTDWLLTWGNWRWRTSSWWWPRASPCTNTFWCSAAVVLPRILHRFLGKWLLTSWSSSLVLITPILSHQSVLVGWAQKWCSRNETTLERDLGDVSAQVQLPPPQVLLLPWFCLDMLPMAYLYWLQFLPMLPPCCLRALWKSCWLVKIRWLMGWKRHQGELLVYPQVPESHCLLVGISQFATQ